METRRQVAERMGYRVEVNEGSMQCALLDPYGKEIAWNITTDDLWKYDLPPLDTWEGVGLVLKWLGEHNYYFEIFYEGCYRDEPYVIRDSTDEGLCGKGIERTSKTVDDFPKAICEFLLEVTK